MTVRDLRSSSVRYNLIIGTTFRFSPRVRKDQSMSNDDEIGYAQPPKASRFKAGVSGNPSGKKKALETFEKRFRTNSQAKYPS